MRMGDRRLPHDIRCYTPPGLHKSGRPEITIGRMSDKEAELAKSSMEELWSMAKDRSLWRITIAA